MEVPAENLIGPLHGGWAMAKETLANERVSLSQRRAPVGPRSDRAGPRRPRARAAGGADGVLRQRLVAAYIEGEIMRYHQLPADLGRR